MEHSGSPFNIKGKIKHWHVITGMLVCYDVVTITAAYFLALWLRFDCSFSKIPGDYYSSFIKSIPVYVIICLFVFELMHLYHSIWRHASYSEMYRLIIATAITLIVNLVLTLVLFGRMPISYYVFGITLQFVFTLGVRFSYRLVLLLRSVKNNKSNDSNCMIIGAGAAGRMIISDIKASIESEDKVACIIDDNPNKWGRYVLDIPVVGGRNTILKNVKAYDIKKIYLAIPSASRLEKLEILNICKETGCQLMDLPGMYQLYNGQVTVSSLKDVQIEDLLGREPVQVDNTQIGSLIAGKRVLVTGGGGSIGSELARQLASYKPEILVIFDIYENNAYSIQQELKREYPDLNLKAIIGSVRDARKVWQVMEEYRPQLVFHAAAHKHVPLMEDSPCEAIKNNVGGTYKTAYASMVFGVERFVLISTDKAVNPTNVMGASKRICEMIVQSFDKMVKSGRAMEIPQIVGAWEGDKDLTDVSELMKYAKTEFVAVRFGNVLGSNGSVIPLFKEQIAKGGPVTVTHPNIIRYFMTIPEAVNLILQAGAYAKGGEIFVLDMGDPVKIDDLARNLIKLSGLKPDIDIDVIYTGLRPGEKLFEEKLMDEEGLTKTANNLIHVAKALDQDEVQLINKLIEINQASHENSSNIVNMVGDIVPTFDHKA